MNSKMGVVRSLGVMAERRCSLSEVLSDDLIHYIMYSFLLVMFYSNLISLIDIDI